MAKTKFFRVAVEGATTDGRVIERDWIAQMAAGYNPATYTARINCEHLRGYSPDAPFNSYGTVVAVKAEEIELQLDGKAQKRLALLAQLDANDQLLAINKAGQKLFTSIEISPNFAATGKAGLVGLAVTDNPASLGTEMLQFAAAKPMFDARKLDKANLFTAADEATIEMEAVSAEPTGIADAIKNGFATVAAMFKADKPADPAPEPKPEPKPKAANDNDMSAFATAIGEQVATAIAAATQPQVDAITSLRAELGTLKNKLDTTEAPVYRRQAATGGAGGIATDC